MARSSARLQDPSSAPRRSGSLGAIQRLALGRLVLLGLALCMVGCGAIAGAGGAWMAMLGTLLLVSSVAWAGPPPPDPPCDGWVHESCNNGRIHEKRHPKGLKVNCAYAPYMAHRANSRMRLTIPPGGLGAPGLFVGRHQSVSG